MAGDKDMSTIAVEIYNEITPGEDNDIEKSKGMEISIINAINNYIEDKNGDFALNPDLDTPQERKAHIESYGLDVDTLPNFTLFGVNLAQKPIEGGFSLMWLIPILAAASQWLSMWLVRKFNGNNMAQAQDPQTQASMKMMDLMMPAMTLFMAFGFSSMMGIYWIYQSALGILQTFVLSKAMPLPKFSEDELKEMKKAQKEAEKNARTVAKNAPKVRSLHYIDDDDYDNLPEIGETKTGKTDGEMNIPEI
jgi:membrane protein insertase Oxa1/YidC/SpoIIIJ